MQQHLRRITDRVVEKGSQAADTATMGLTKAGKRGSQAVRGAYGYAMNHPKTTTAVVLGAGVAAALIWMMQRSGGYSEVRKRVLERVRRQPVSSP